MLFIDFSSAFNTIIPQQLINKLNLLGLNNSLCNWILDFLTRRPQTVRVGHNTSSTTTLSTGAPQGCVLSPLLFTLLTHDCTAKFSSNHIIKFADDTTHSTGAPLRVCWPAASLSGTGTAVLLTARPSSGQWTRLERSSVPLSHPSWTFSLHDAPAKPTALWRNPPTPPTVSSSSYHQEDVPEHQSPLRQTAQQLFPPGCESPEPKSPRPPLKPHANPYLLKHGPPPPLQTPPNLTTPRKNCVNFFVQFKCATHRWVGLYKPPVATHSPLCALDTFHTLLCVHNPTKDSAIYVCLHAHALQIILYCSPASCLTHNVSLCTCTVFMWSIHIVCIFYLLSLVV